MAAAEAEPETRRRMYCCDLASYFRKNTYQDLPILRPFTYFSGEEGEGLGRGRGRARGRGSGRGGRGGDGDQQPYV